jgi:hypothetical protein
MKNPLLTGFLKTALDIQELPFAGIRVFQSTLLATNGYQLVAYRMPPSAVRGEGMLHPVTARAVLTYADILDAAYDGLTVDGNKVTLKVFVSKHNTHFFSLPALECEIKRIERIFDNLEDTRFVADGIRAKYLLPPDAGEFVKVGRGGLVSASEDEDFRYSTKQIRKCAEMFRAKDELMLSSSPDGLLMVENEWGQLFVVTPYRKPKQS